MSIHTYSSMYRDSHPRGRHTRPNATRVWIETRCLYSHSKVCVYATRRSFLTTGDQPVVYRLTPMVSTLDVGLHGFLSRMVSVWRDTRQYGFLSTYLRLFRSVSACRSLKTDRSLRFSNIKPSLG